MNVGGVCGALGIDGVIDGYVDLRWCGCVWVRELVREWVGVCGGVRV